VPDMSAQASLLGAVQSAAASLEAAVRDGLPARAVFERLRDTLANVVAFKVLTVLKLDPATLLLVRLAALAAVDAPAASYLMHLGPMVESGVKVDQVQDVLVAVAPIAGAPRVLSAATKITEALGITIAVAEMAAEADAGASME